MNWQEAQEKANETGNWPPNLTECEKEQYRCYQASIYFNESHGINGEYTELLKDAKHRIIADALTRQKAMGVIDEYDEQH